MQDGIAYNTRQCVGLMVDALLPTRQWVLLLAGSGEIIIIDVFHVTLHGQVYA